MMNEEQRKLVNEKLKNTIVSVGKAIQTHLKNLNQQGISVSDAIINIRNYVYAEHLYGPNNYLLEEVNNPIVEKLDMLSNLLEENLVCLGLDFEIEADVPIKDNIRKYISNIFYKLSIFERVEQLILIDNTKNNQKGIFDNVGDFTNEIGKGIMDSLSSTVNLVFHPIDSVYNTYHSITNPIETIKNVSNFAYENPTRFASSLVTGMVVSYGIGKVIPDVSNNVISSNEVVKKSLLTDNIKTINSVTQSSQLTSSLIKNTTVISQTINDQVKNNKDEEIESINWEIDLDEDELNNDNILLSNNSVHQLLNKNGIFKNTILDKSIIKIDDISIDWEDDINENEDNKSKFDTKNNININSN